MAKRSFGKVELDTEEYGNFLFGEGYLYPTSSNGVYKAAELCPFFEKAQKELDRLLSQVSPAGQPTSVSPNEEIHREYFLIGHGKTGTNKEGKITGWSGDMLAEEGIQRAKEQEMSFWPQISDLCFVSDLPRAIHHALILSDNPLVTRHTGLSAKLDELSKKVSNDVKRKSVDNGLYQELMTLALERGFIPTPMLRAQYYGPLELLPEKLREENKEEFIELLVLQAPPGADSAKVRREAEDIAYALIHRKELLFAPRNDSGNHLTENRADLVKRIAQFYESVNKVSSGKKILVVTSSGCFDASNAYFRYFANRVRISIENEPKQRGRELVAKLGTFRGEPCYLNDSKLLDGLKEKARGEIRQLRQISIDSLVREGKGIVGAPLLRIKNKDAEEPTDIMESYGFSGPSISGVLDCKKPVLIFGHGGQGKTILLTEIAKHVLEEKNNLVPFLQNAEDINIKSRHATSMYDYLCSASGISSLPATCLKENKAVFLIDDYHKLNPESTNDFDEAVKRLAKDGHKIVLFSRLERSGVLPPEVPGYGLFQINLFSSSKIDSYMAERIPKNQQASFRDEISRYADASGNYFTLSFLASLFGGHKGDVLQYVLDDKIVKALSEKQSLTQTQLYDALTDYVVGLDVERINANRLPVADVRTETARLKNLLAQKAGNEAEFARIIDVSNIDAEKFNANLEEYSRLKKELQGISLIYASNDFGFRKRVKKNVADHLNAVFRHLYLDDDYHSFVHDTLREFFGAKYIFGQMQAKNPEPLRRKVSRKTWEFLAEMNPDRSLLYEWIYSTRFTDQQTCGLLGGNSATLLALLGEDLRRKDFSDTSLTGADLSDKNLEGLNLRNARLDKASFTCSNTRRVRLSNLERKLLGQEDRREYFDLVGCDGVRGSLYFVTRLGSLVKWSISQDKEIMRMKVAHPDYGSLETYVHYKFRLSPRRDLLLNTTDGKVDVYDLKLRQRVHFGDGCETEHIQEAGFSPDGRLIALIKFDPKSGARPSIILVDSRSRKVMSTTRIYCPSDLKIGQIVGTSISPDNKYVASCFSGKTGTRKTGIRFSSFVKIHQIQGGSLQELRPFPQLVDDDYNANWAMPTIFSHDSKLFTTYRGVFSANMLRNGKDEVVFPFDESIREKYHILPRFFTKDNRYLFVNGRAKLSTPDDFTAFYDLKTGKVIPLFESFAQEMALSNDKDMALCYGNDAFHAFLLKLKDNPSSGREMIVPTYRFGNCSLNWKSIYRVPEGGTF